MKILVTGGAGFIGSFLVDMLVEEGHRVTVFDNLDSQVHCQGELPPYFNENAELIIGDIRDYDKVKKVVKNKDVIYHLAAAVGVGQSQYEVKKYSDVNISGTSNLLQAIIERGDKIRKLILSSSMSVYGEGTYNCNKCGIVYPKSRKSDDLQHSIWEMKCNICGRAVDPVATNENTFLRCNSIYSLTKKNQEEMCLSFSHTYSLPFISLRLFNVFGPRQSLSNPYTGVIAIFLARLENNNPPVIYEDGKQTRDFVSVHDAVYALLSSLHVDSGKQIFNIGTGQNISILQLAAELSNILGINIPPNITCKYRKGDIRHCFADISLAKEILRYSPKVELEEELRELVNGSERTNSHDYFDKYHQELIKRNLLV